MRLTDEQWDLVRPLLPPSAPRAERGRPSVYDRGALEGILWKIGNNAPWYDMPAQYPSHQTCYRRYRQWKRDHILPQVLTRLYDDLLERGGFDLQRLVQTGRITFVGCGRKTHPVPAPEIQDTWQYNTARVFIGLAIRNAVREGVI